jgi:S1-C subfamily serine protease
MSTIYDAPVQTEPGQGSPYEPWPGPGGPGGPGGPYGYGGGGDGPGGRPVGHTRRRRLLLAAVALVVGAGTFATLQATGAGTGTVQTTAQITSSVSPGLVDIVSTLGYQQARAAGTGMVLTSSGEVLTNNHVIAGATSIRATDIGNGRTYPAKVVGYNQSHDIAVLQLQGASGLSTVSLGNSSSATVGQKVVALGNAGGKGGAPSVVTGHITGLGASITANDAGSGTSENLTGLIHHNAPIQAGDSGGPLVSTAGKVIGINTAASQANGFELQSGQQPPTAAFAIPINEAVSIADQIEAGTGSGTVHIGATGFLGVQILSANGAAQNGIQAGTGAVVAGTLPGSPAEQAGLGAGDVITSAAGQHVTSPTELQTALEQHHPGDSVTITWTDQTGQTHSASVNLTTGPAA